MSDLIEQLKGDRVAVTLPKADLGGVDYYAKGLIEELKEKGFEVVEIEFPNTYSGLLSDTINSTYHLRKKILSKQKEVDTVILSDYSHGIGFNPKNVSPKVFTTVHHLHEPNNLLQRTIHSLSIKRLKQTDQIISASEHTKKKLKEEFDLNSIEYNQGVKNFPEGQLPDSVEKPYILYVGNHRPRKNIPLLLETFEKIVEENNEIKLVLAGNHRGAEKTRKIIEEKNLNKRVIITGRVSEEELGRLYRDAELYVHTADKEGYSRTVREAKKKETEVVAVQNPLMDGIIGGENTFPANSEKLSEAILEVIK
jgi:glycosyltransferase involved in cell wall biosynthesis